MMELVGHIIGLIAIGLFCLSYQIFDKKKLLAVQTLATAAICLQYLLIGAYSGFALNFVCVVRNLLFYRRDKMGRFGMWLPPILAVVMGGLSLLSWDGWHSLFIICGLMINTVCMGYFHSQNLRKSILVTCPMVLTYNVFEGSYAGIISESISIASSVVGIIRYRNAKTTNVGNRE